MTTTPNLNLPFILAAQAQKHVTHNESIRALDALVQIGVLDRDMTGPPVSPIEGARYIIAAAANGAWAGKSGQIAAYQDGAWAYYPPQLGWLAWVADEMKLAVWDGSAWSDVTSQGGALNPVPMVGVNAVADTTNRLSVSSTASLFNHDGEGHRINVNKAAQTDTAALLFQTGFLGRAEVGLTGDDNLHVKVSPDGTQWLEAIVADRSSGLLTVHGDPTVALGVATRRYVERATGENLLINGDFGINQRGFAGGALGAGTYGYDRWKAGAAGASISISNGNVTLSTGEVVQVVESPNLGGQQVTLSVEDLTGGSLDVDIEGQTGAIAPGSGRRGVTVTVPAASTGHVTVNLSPTSGSVTFARVRLEAGDSATHWIARHPSLELLLCTRYFERMSGATGDRYIRRGYGAQTGGQYYPIQFFARKRVAPTVTLLNVTGSNASNQQAFNPSVYEFEFYHSVTATNGFTFFGYSASAEL